MNIINHHPVRYFTLNLANKNLISPLGIIFIATICAVFNKFNGNNKESHFHIRLYLHTLA